ncbi:hypothetical protein CL656_03150 [bacterium]|nr:hypothetical protein [bacterium]|tara:strand:+ start:3762 stop:4355 length:594 start_codon:yes stop_codon:yes gene_type:complete
MFSFVDLPIKEGVYNGQEVTQKVRVLSGLHQSQRKSEYGTFMDTSIKTQAQIELVLSQNPDVKLQEFNIFSNPACLDVLARKPESQTFGGQTYLPGFEPFQPILESSFNHLDHQNIFGIHVGKTFREIEKGRYESFTTKNFYLYPELRKLRVETLHESMSYYPGKRRQFDISNKLLDTCDSTSDEIHSRIYEILKIY